MTNTMALTSLDLSTVHGGNGTNPCPLNLDTIVDGANRYGQAGALGGAAVGASVGVWGMGVSAVPAAGVGGIIGGTVGALYGVYRGSQQARQQQQQCLAAQRR